MQRGDRAATTLQQEKNQNIQTGRKSGGMVKGTKYVSRQTAQDGIKIRGV